MAIKFTDKSGQVQQLGGIDQKLKRELAHMKPADKFRPIAAGPSVRAGSGGGGVPEPPVQSPPKPIEVLRQTVEAMPPPRWKLMSIKVPMDVWQAWKALGPGYQTRINALLREHMP